MSQPPVPPSSPDFPPDQPPAYQVGQVVNGHVWTGTEWVPQGQAGSGVPQAQVGQPDVGPVTEVAKPKTKKPIYKRWWAWAVAAVVLVIIIVAISGGDGDQVATPEASMPATTQAAKAKKTEPAPKPSEPAKPAGNAQIAEDYGSFDTLTKAGTGDATIKLPGGAKAGMVTATHKGSSNFSVSALDENNESTGDLLVNDIGAYKGVTAFGLNSVGDAVKLKIDADGAWTVKISSLENAPTLDLPVKQEGDRVYVYNGKAADWAIANKGKGNFVVIQQTSIMPNLMVNEIGRYKGTVPATAGPNVVTVQSDGAWSIAKG